MRLWEKYITESSMDTLPQATELVLINGHKVMMHENISKATELEYRREGIYGNGKRETVAE
jgi:hypothetical protein